MTKQLLWCAEGRHYWTREGKGGRKPPSCPDHTVSKEEAKSVADRVERLNGTLELQKQIEDIKLKLVKAEDNYNAALREAAMKNKLDEINKAYNHADRMMQTIQNLSRRLDQLEKSPLLSS